MRTLTQLVGTTATTSPQTYGDSFTTLANNNSAQAVAIGKALCNNVQRYLLQKFFDNERTVRLTTVGAQSLTLTVAPVAGNTSGTLTSAWTYPNCQQLLTFSDGEQVTATFTLNSTAVTWDTPLTGDSTTSITTVGVQNYAIPADVSKLKDNTLNVGQLKYHPKPVQSIQEWNNINFLPYVSDIPNYTFIYNGKLGIFPIPSTTGNIITFNYKSRVIDMSYDDYTTGTLANSGMTIGSTTVTGVSTAWTAYPQNVDITSQSLYLRADVSTGGDGIWYQIKQFTSATTLELVLPVINAPNITTSTTYTIGQVPLLEEDFQDMIVFGALRIYFSTIVENESKYKQYDSLYKEKYEMLKEYAGTKTVNLDLEEEPQAVNPNLFIYSPN